MSYQRHAPCAVVKTPPEGETLGETEGETDGEILTDGDRLAEGLTEMLGDTDGEIDGEIDGDFDGDFDGEIDGPAAPIKYFGISKLFFSNHQHKWIIFHSFSLRSSINGSKIEWRPKVN